MATKKPPHSETNNLMKACALGDVSSVRRILANTSNTLEVELRRRDNHGWSPLHHAVASNSVKCVQLLLEQTQLNRRFRNHEGETPLHLAVTKPRTNIEIVRLLLEGDRPDGAHSNNESVSLLHRAVQSNRLDILQTIVEHQVDINAVDLDGDTCLHLAVYNQTDEAIVDYILSWPGFDAGQKNENELSPLVTVLLRWNEYENPDVLFGLVEKLLPRTFPLTDGKPGVYNPMDILEPAAASIALIDRKYFTEDPQKLFRFFLEHGGYLDPEINSLYPTLKFFIDNYYPENKSVDSMYYCIQLALHGQLGLKLKHLAELLDNYRDASLLEDFMYYMLEKVCISDAHFQFTMEMYKMLRKTDVAKNSNAAAIETLILRITDEWLSGNPSVEYLERATKWLNFYRTEGVDFDGIFMTFLDSEFNYVPTLRMLAPFCLKLQLNTINTDTLSVQFWSTLIADDEKGYPTSTIPTVNYPTLKFLCRKRILRTHEHKLNKYFENVAQLELPNVLKDYLCFKPTKYDYLNLFI